MEHGRRIIEIHGLLNVRDFGGLPVEAGGETICGRVFRGPQPDDLSKADVDAIVGDSGVRRIIDLRTEAEGEHGRSSLIAGAVIGRHEISMLEEPITPAKLTSMGEQGMFLTYLGGLENIDCVSEILSLLSDDSGYPTYLHCTVGKDRTGVITALVLDAIGVKRQAIVEDYALSGRYMDQIIERRRSSNPAARKRMDAVDPRLFKIVMGAEPETMEKTLAGIDEKYGSPAEYILNLENGEAILEGLKRKLLAD